MESIKEILQWQPAAAEIWMPVLDLATAVQRHNFMTQVAQTLMVEGTDFGKIPGTGSQRTLLKAGAEKLCTLFGISPEVFEEQVTEDWDGARHGGGAFFLYRIKGRDTKKRGVPGERIGSWNSWETKFR